MLKTIRHRGPDSSVSHFWGDNVLLQTDHSYNLRDQVYPVSQKWAGERYTIVFDGVIFNREELKRALNCDAEDMDDAQLMLRGYIAWKQTVLERVNGVFALAIAHERENKLFLARDRMGVKPLFYMRNGKGLIFASEMKTILSVPGVSAQLCIVHIFRIAIQRAFQFFPIKDHPLKNNGIALARPLNTDRIHLIEQTKPMICLKQHILAPKVACRAVRPPMLDCPQHILCNSFIRCCPQYTGNTTQTISPTFLPKEYMPLLKLMCV